MGDEDEINSKGFCSRRVRSSRRREKLHQTGNTGFRNSLSLNPSCSNTQSSRKETKHNGFLSTFNYRSKRETFLVKPKPNTKPVIVKEGVIDDADEHESGKEEDTEDDDDDEDDEKENEDGPESNNIKSSDKNGTLSPSETEEECLEDTMSCIDDHDGFNGGHDDKSPMTSTGLEEKDSDRDNWFSTSNSDSWCTTSSSSSSVPSPAPRASNLPITQTPRICYSSHIYTTTDDDSDVDTGISNKSRIVYEKNKKRKATAGPSVSPPSVAPLALPTFPQAMIVLDKLSPKTISRYTRPTGRGPPLKKRKLENGESEASSNDHLDGNIFSIDSDVESYMKLTNSEVTGNRVHLAKDYIENLVGFVEPSTKMELFESYPGVKWAPVKLSGDIKSGFLTIDPMTVKPFEQPMSKSIIFYVLKGNITVRSSAFEQYSDKRYLYGKSIKQGSCIHIPSSTYYTFENRSRTAVKLGYVVVEDEDKKCP